MDFKEAFDFPLRISDRVGSIVFTNNYHRAFDFMIQLEDDCYKKCIDIINGDAEPTKQHIFTHVRGIVYMDDVALLRVRNWGYLTGVGGLNLEPKTAFQLQCDFAEYVMNQLTIK